MAEGCGVDLKNLRANFRIENFPCHEIFIDISRRRKTLVISTPNQILLCNYFEHLLVYMYDLDVLLYVPGIRMNTLLNLLQVDFRFFSLPHFSRMLAGQKFKMKEIFVLI